MPRPALVHMLDHEATVLDEIDPCLPGETFRLGADDPTLQPHALRPHCDRILHYARAVFRPTEDVHQFDPAGDVRTDG